MIGRRLVQAGLIQFGLFKRRGDFVPVDLQLSMLVSYPDLLAEIAEQAAEALANISISRLLATADALPLGVALALRLKLPLVYSRGIDASPVDDLVGAYDIGHPALLVTNTIGFGASVEPLINGARRVGLEVHSLLTVVEARPILLHGVDVIALVRLQAIVDDFAATGELPGGQADVVRAWLSG